MDPFHYEWTPEASTIRDEAKPLLEKLRADITGTLAFRRQIAEQVVGDWVEHGIGLAETPEQFALSVAEGIQQYFHDAHVDTTWPPCPEHGNHPLWLHLYPEGMLRWECEQGSFGAPLGTLTPADAEAVELPELSEIPDDAEGPGG